jgi:hypothetical protein
MSDPTNDEQSARSTGRSGGDDPQSKSLEHVESPGIAPDRPETIEAAAPRAEAAKTEPTLTKPVVGDQDTGHQREHTDAGIACGTALVLAPPRAKTGAPRPEPAPSKSSRTFGLRSLAAMVVAAAAVGGLAGALATAGVSYLTPSRADAPSYYAVLAESLGRVDHDLTVLKSGVDSSAKSTGQQVARFAERMDRVEKAQADAGAKLAKATDSIDRMERRLANAAGDVTGTIAEPHVAMATPLAPGPDMKRIPPGPIVEGWVLRDVYNGTAMIQNRAGIIQVMPGDSLPALGRIEQVRRQDGRWVVVTSRGLILPR